MSENELLEGIRKAEDQLREFPPLGSNGVPPYGYDGKPTCSGCGHCPAALLDAVESTLQESRADERAKIRAWAEKNHYRDEYEDVENEVVYFDELLAFLDNLGLEESKDE